MKFLLDEKLFLTHIMGKNSFNGFTKSRWLSVFILPANRNKNAYPSLQASTIFQLTSLKGQIFLYFGENEEKQNIVTVLIFVLEQKQRQTANLILASCPGHINYDLFIIYKPVMYFGISSETFWRPPCHPPLPLPLSPLFCPFWKYCSFL